MAKTRRIIQLLFLGFFIFLFFSTRYPYKVTIPGDFFLHFSPLTPLFYFIDSLTVPLYLWPALLILLLTPLLGRFFCGWICPLGTSLDIAAHLLKPPNNRKSRDRGQFRWIKFALLSGFVILAVFSIHLWSYFDPLSIFTRLTAIVFYPFSTLVTEKMLQWGSQLPGAENFVYSLYDWFKTYLMPEKQAFYNHLAVTVIFLFLVFGLEKVSRRFWCRNLCPAWALLGFLSQFRFYERIVTDTCPICNKCQIECKMNAISEGDVRSSSKVECIECFSCGEKCPEGYSSIVYRWRWKPYHSVPDFQRRQFLATAASGVVTAGLLSMGIPQKLPAANRLIRPPGAIPEQEFLDRCIRCMECVRMCQSNGACLQPGGFDLALENLWTPVADMRKGYCEYTCNLCGQVCPTDAILPLPLKEKQQTPMGIAYFDKNLCIPYVRNEDCLVCEEHCPTPDKAIKFDHREARLPDGTTRMVKYPYVVRELCIGCGICEYKCPVPNQPGIFVVRENEKRLDALPG